MIILDFGSGNTCRNNFEYAKKMVNALSIIDPRSQNVVIKWQLFDKAGDNIPLQRWLFAKIHEYAWGHGYETTASVFDEISLAFLMKFDVPFVKVANRPDLYWLIDRVPSNIPVVKSVGSKEEFTEAERDNIMCCVSEYPADIKAYEKTFPKEQLKRGISDHTSGLVLYKKYKPELYECHFCLDDSTGLDAGPFAKRPNELKEIL